MQLARHAVAASQGHVLLLRSTLNTASFPPYERGLDS
jgi:hypothetical protein